MKKYLAFLILLSLFSCRRDEASDGKIIELPVRYEQGFGPFSSSYGFLVPEHKKSNPEAYPWFNTYPEISGIPKAWKGVIKSMVWLDAYQFVYQNYHQGNVDSAFISDLKKSWKWEPDETRLSRKPIRCYVYVVRGKDETGKVAVMIDTNNNLDFSDEKAFYPERSERDSTLRNYGNVHRIEYDMVRNGRVTISFLPMVVKYLPKEPHLYDYWYTFPQYAETSIEIDGKVHKLAVSQGFHSPYAEDSPLALPENVRKGEYVPLAETIPTGQHIVIGGSKKKFKNLGLDLARNVLRLQMLSDADSTYFARSGDVFKPIKTANFLTREEITSADFKGKYLFVDFWGTWCKGCVEQLPKLKEVYKKTDKSRVEFLGVASLDDPKRLARFLKRSPLDWPQVLSDSANDMVTANSVNSFPSNFLIGPDGKIVSRDIGSGQLESVLTKLGCIKN